VVAIGCRSIGIGWRRAGIHGTAGLQDFLAEKRRSLSKHLRSRLAQSVTEGELPEGANCEALANLCLTPLSGLTFRVLDGAPPSLLFRSIELFVNALGFKTSRRQATSRAARRSRPLTL